MPEMPKHGTLRTLAAGAMAAVLAGTIAAAVPAQDARAEYRGFPDVPADHWAVEAGTIDWAAQHGAVEGYPDGTWQPDTALDRAAAAGILRKAAGKPDPAGAAAQFPDVDSSEWYATPVLWAREQGIFGGDDVTGTFDPAAPITREQVAKVLCEYAGFGQSDPAALDAYSDAEGVSGWAEGYLAWAVEAGVVSGREVEPGTFELAAQEGCTRAEFATMLARTVDGAMEGADLSGKSYVVDATWAPEYGQVEVPVYENKWVADTFTGEITRTYCRWCGYSTDIPRHWFLNGAGFVDTVWFQKYDDVLGHIQRNDCGCPPEVDIDPVGAFDGSVGQSRGTGQINFYGTIELETGHYESVQTGTTTETVEVGGRWGYGEGRWE